MGRSYLFSQRGPIRHISLERLASAALVQVRVREILAAERSSSGISRIPSEHPLAFR